MATTNLNVRFPEKYLHKAIVAAAKRNKRSLNSEILHAIEFYLKNAPEAKPEEPPIYSNQSEEYKKATEDAVSDVVSAIKKRIDKSHKRK